MVTCVISLISTVTSRSLRRRSSEWIGGNSGAQGLDDLRDLLGERGYDLLGQSLNSGRPKTDAHASRNDLHLALQTGYGNCPDHNHDICTVGGTVEAHAETRSAHTCSSNRSRDLEFGLAIQRNHIDANEAVFDHQFGNRFRRFFRESLVINPIVVKGICSKFINRKLGFRLDNDQRPIVKQKTHRATRAGFYSGPLLNKLTRCGWCRRPIWHGDGSRATLDLENFDVSYGFALGMGKRN